MVTRALLMSLAEAYWIMPAHVVGLAGNSLVRGPMAASLAWRLLVATTLTRFTIPILFRLAMQIGPALRGGVSSRLRRPAAVCSGI